MLTIRGAVEKLDYRADEQWTQDGLPSVDYLAEATKNPALTREMVQAFCPGYNRHAAEDRTLAQL